LNPIIVTNGGATIGQMHFEVGCEAPDLRGGRSSGGHLALVIASEKGKALGSTGTKQSRFVDGVLTIRLGSKARKAVKRGSVKLAAELKSGGKTRRISVLVRVK
jgi:hypothetical protein